jgi:excinuclease ABC subunit C
MSALPASILDKIPHLPESPGVYLWKDADGTVMYVGKAKRLRSRVRSYANLERIESVRTYALMKQVAAVETIVVPTEAHALILEANLIKEHRPRFNISLRDDKSYPHIKVTVHEPFPRVYVTRRIVADGSRYFGPYTDVAQMRRSLNVVKRIFTVRSCNYDLPTIAPDRPCLDHHIGRCKAPCVLLQSQAEYRVMSSPPSRSILRVRRSCATPCVTWSGWRNPRSCRSSRVATATWSAMHVTATMPASH